MAVGDRVAVDFRALYDSTPDLYLVLTPDLSILAASDAYLKATMLRREAILGRRFDDVFPNNPDDPQATGTRNLRTSFERVRTERATHVIALQKYDIRRSEEEGGGFEERYWSAHNSPVLDDANELLYILHRAEDVTEKVRMQRRDAERQAELDDQRRGFEQFFSLSLDMLQGYLFAKPGPPFPVVNEVGEVTGRKS